MCQFDIIDHDSNISDHLPLHIVCKWAIFEATGKPSDKNNVNNEICVERFRWDHGDLLQYYNATRQLSVLDDINTTDLSLFDSSEGVHEFAGNIYDRTVNALHEYADLYIPKHKKGITSFGGIKCLIY